MKSIGVAAVILCLALPAAGQDRYPVIKTTVTELQIKLLPEKTAATNERIGTTVLLTLSSETEGALLTAVQIDRSKITFKDSTGKDLFAAGKKARQEYDKTAPVFGGMRSVENALSVNPPRWIGRDKVEPGAIYLRCHALATPDENATSVSIKGRIDVYTSSEETRITQITKAQLTSRKGFRLGEHQVKLVGAGGGIENNRRYGSYEIESRTMLKQVAVVGRDEGPSPVVLKKQTLRVYSKELAEDDEIAITYTLPQKVAMALDLEVSPGSVGVSAVLLPFGAHRP